MSRLWALIAAGVVIRLIVVHTTKGTPFDIDSYRLVYEGLKTYKLEVYDNLAPIRWPYPPGYMPWAVVAGEVGGDFAKVIRYGAVLADIALIWLVHDLVRRVDGPALPAAALVALGPIFIGVSGFNGQVDPAATVPALFAYWVWTRPGQRHRGWLAGGLLGLAASIKTVPGILALAFLAAARDVREAGSIAVAAGAVFGVICLPFLLGSQDMVSTMTGYQGLPGFGGISLFAQPTFAAHFLAGEPGGDPSVVAVLRDDLPKLVLLPALALMAGFLLWKRPDVLTGICLIFLTIYVFGVNLFLSYLVWSLPFFIVRGHLRAVLAVQLFLAPAQITVFAAEPGSPVPFAVGLVVYTATVGAAWLATVGLLGGWVRRLAA